MQRPRLLQVFAAVALTCAALAASAAEPTTTLKDSGDAAHLFGYLPKPGMDAQFDAGYRKHLEWHRTHDDPLVWYGWYVTHGPRMGMFIDGTFGAPFAAFDNRVAPSDDGKDADRTFLPYGEPTYRAVYRVRRDLSAGTPLEQWRPTKLVQVYTYEVRLGRSERFEKIVKRMRAALDTAKHKSSFTWYEGVGGTASPGYMLMVSREGWSAFDEGPGGLEGVLASVEDTTVRQQLLDGFAGTVDEVQAEIWSYRSDMSLIPSN
ncbi:hypothetical protein LF41_1439 [Lysobacter dokdonensis DS-58]|uniref:Uncharacterized protein n=1 Tax=Lysobacter dokdonensis DS-58 TaxID=1300345 RepID=A0A0A2WIL1_9GAMM|nr:hypothetical protein [Lysobacter dokdonensis]KGQ18085.1 hypothetical protein LF41_1439 [Lysobacter dokdonensis DS-58]